MYGYYYGPQRNLKNLSHAAGNPLGFNIDWGQAFSDPGLRMASGVASSASSAAGGSAMAGLPGLLGGVAINALGGLLQGSDSPRHTNLNRLDGQSQLAWGFDPWLMYLKEQYEHNFDEAYSLGYNSRDQESFSSSNKGPTWTSGAAWSPYIERYSSSSAGEFVAPTRFSLDQWFGDAKHHDTVLANPESTETWWNWRRDFNDRESLLTEQSVALSESLDQRYGQGLRSRYFRRHGNLLSRGDTLLLKRSSLRDNKIASKYLPANADDTNPWTEYVSGDWSDPDSNMKFKVKTPFYARRDAVRSDENQEVSTPARPPTVYTGRGDIYDGLPAGWRYWWLTSKAASMSDSSKTNAVMTLVRAPEVLRTVNGKTVSQITQIGGDNGSIELDPKAEILVPKSSTTIGRRTLTQACAPGFLSDIADDVKWVNHNDQPVDFGTNARTLHYSSTQGHRFFIWDASDPDQSFHDGKFGSTSNSAPTWWPGYDTSSGVVTYNRAAPYDSFPQNDGIAAVTRSVNDWVLSDQTTGDSQWEFEPDSRELGLFESEFGAAAGLGTRAARADKESSVLHDSRLQNLAADRRAKGFPDSDEPSAGASRAAADAEYHEATWREARASGDQPQGFGAAADNLSDFQQRAYPGLGVEDRVGIPGPSGVSDAVFGAASLAREQQDMQRQAQGAGQNASRDFAMRQQEFQHKVAIDREYLNIAKFQAGMTDQSGRPRLPVDISIGEESEPARTPPPRLPPPPGRTPTPTPPPTPTPGPVHVPVPTPGTPGRLPDPRFSEEGGKTHGRSNPPPPTPRDSPPPRFPTPDDPLLRIPGSGSPRSPELPSGSPKLPPGSSGPKPSGVASAKTPSVSGEVLKALNSNNFMWYGKDAKGNKLWLVRPRSEGGNPKQWRMDVVRWARNNPGATWTDFYVQHPDLSRHHGYSPRTTRERQAVRRSRAGRQAGGVSWSRVKPFVRGASSVAKRAGGSSRLAAWGLDGLMFGIDVGAAIYKHFNPEEPSRVDSDQGPGIEHREHRRRQHAAEVHGMHEDLLRQSPEDFMKNYEYLVDYYDQATADRYLDQLSAEGVDISPYIRRLTRPGYSPKKRS